MLEIAIIICLAVVLFLALKNYPKAAREAKEGGQEEELTEKGLLGGLFNLNLKRENFDAIKDEIAKGGERIVPPVEINKAKETYRQEDSEIVRMLCEADQAFLENDLRMAEEIAIQILMKEKKCAPAYVMIGKVAYHRGSFDDAREAYKTAIKCDRENGGAYFGMGQIDLRDENISKAIENFQKAVSFDRGKAEWYAELGEAYLQARQFAKAAKALKRASSLDVDNKEYRILASEAEDKQRAHAQAWGNKR